VGILVPAKVHEVLLAMANSKLNTVSQAKKALAKEGLDLYGNKVDYIEYPAGDSLLTVEKKDQNSPIVLVSGGDGSGQHIPDFRQ